MRLGRLIPVPALALAIALSSQPAPAQHRIAAPREQGLRQGARPPKGNPNKSVERLEGGAHKTNRTGAADPAANGGKVARPPNEAFFKPNPNVVRNLPPRAQQHVRDMSPQEQQHFQQNYQRFQNLTPQQKAAVQQKFQQWKTLSPAEKDRITEAEQRWERMTPEQRQLYQSKILPKWELMSPDRRQLIVGRQHTLQGMSPEQREAALNDPRFMQGLTPDEQDVLRNLNSLRGPNPW